MSKIYSFQDIGRCVLYGELVTECLRDIEICILEDRHVARVVRNAAKQLLHYLKEAISQHQYAKDSKGNMVKYGNFKTNLFGQELHIRWQVLFTDDGLKLPPCSYNENTKTILLYLIETSQGINFLRAAECLQHEIDHFYETQQRQTPYKDADWYEYASKRMQYGGIGKPIAHIIYVSRQREITAFANGAYSHLMNSDDYINGFDEAIQDTELFRWLQGVKYDLNYIQQYGPNDKSVQDEIGQYNGLSYEMLVQIATDAIKKLATTLGTIKTKAIEDYRNEHNIIESQTYSTDLDELKRDRDLYLYYGLEPPKELQNIDESQERYFNWNL